MRLASAPRDYRGQWVVGHDGRPGRCDPVGADWSAYHDSFISPGLTYLAALIYGDVPAMLVGCKDNESWLGVSCFTSLGLVNSTTIDNGCSRALSMACRTHCAA